MYKKNNGKITGFLLTVILVFLILPVTTSVVFASYGTCGKQCKWTYSGTTLTFEYNDTNGSGSLISAVGPIKTGLSDADKQNVTDVVIKDDIQAIQKDSFSGYKALTSVKIGKDVSNIGELAFYNCIALESITIPDSVSSIGEKAFFLSGLKEIKLSENLTSLGESAFQACKSLKSVKIPGKLKTIPKQCFYSCDSLLTVNMAAGVEKIDTSAFQFCSSLYSVGLPSTVDTIGNAVFGSCTKLGGLDLSHVKSLGHLSVSKCLGLGDIRLSNVLKDVDDQAFLNNYTNKKVVFDGTREEFAKIANKEESKNTDLLTGSVEYLQSSSALPKVADIEKVILTLSGKAEVPGSSFLPLRARAVKTRKKMIQLKWKAVPGASGYLIYGGERKGVLQKLENIKNGSTVSYIHRSLKPNRYYRYIVVAYQNMGSGTEDPRVLSCSKVIFAATLGGKFRNTQAVKTGSNKITLKKGKKQKLGASVASKASTGKKYRNFLKIRYESNNPAVATVNRNGRIKAVGKGKCYVFAYAQDGIFKRVRVIVK